MADVNGPSERDGVMSAGSPVRVALVVGAVGVGFLLAIAFPADLWTPIGASVRLAVVIVFAVAVAWWARTHC
jgi:hypothetical protein